MQFPEHAAGRYKMHRAKAGCIFAFLNDVLKTHLMIAQTPQPPYYAVLFTSLRTEGDQGYGTMADRMEELAMQQPGYLGHESARDGLGITISYWASLEDIRTGNGRQNTGRHNSVDGLPGTANTKSGSVRWIGTMDLLAGNP